MPGLVLGMRGRPERSEGCSGVEEARLCRALSWLREEGLSAAKGVRAWRRLGWDGSCPS